MNSSADTRILSRAEFSRLVRQRDQDRCVICGRSGDPGGLDAHHIIERRLFSDGGYYLANGALLCRDQEKEPGCHRKAEETLISCEEIRQAAGIDEVLLPEDFDPAFPHTKWGDPILPDGRRRPGLLFYEAGVQKLITRAGLGHLYELRFKYPRTLHLPFSPGASADDRIHKDLSSFDGEEIVVTEKLDGENSSIYCDGYFHARSIDSRAHPSQTRIRQLAARRGPELPTGWRVVLENLYALHALPYQELPSFEVVLALYDETNTCLSWDETSEWADLLELPLAPVIWRGVFKEKDLLELDWQESAWGGSAEGYVARLARSFPHQDHEMSSAKFVREGLVEAEEEHWSQRPIVPNKLANATQKKSSA